MSKYTRNVARNPVKKVNLARERFMYPQSVPNRCQERTSSQTPPKDGKEERRQEVRLAEVPGVLRPHRQGRR